MTAEEVLAELESLGTEQTKKTFLRHGATEPMFGVKIGDMKPIQKRIKRDHQLSLDLFSSGVGDAQYLAGLIADPPAMTKAQLKAWAKAATWQMVREYVVAGVAAESRFAVELAEEWIASKKEEIATIGWATYSHFVSVAPDDQLDLDRLRDLLKHVGDDIHEAANRTRYVMNGFVISVGSHVKPLLKEAKAAAKKIGAVSVNVGDTACKVPLATEYIAKVEKAGRVGKKRASAMC